MVLVLIFFPLQYVVNQINHTRLLTVNNIVHIHAQKARTDGYFTPENIEEMKQEIKNIFPALNDTEISIMVTTTPKYRFNEFDLTEMINYEVTVPIKKIIAMHQFYNISDSENQFNYTIKGAVQSELLAP